MASIQAYPRTVFPATSLILTAQRTLITLPQVFRRPVPPAIARQRGPRQFLTIRQRNFLSQEHMPARHASPVTPTVNMQPCRPLAFRATSQTSTARRIPITSRKVSRRIALSATARRRGPRLCLITARQNFL